MFFGGVVVVSLDLFDLSFGHCLTNRCSLLGRIPYSTCPSKPFYPEFLGATEERSKYGTFSQVFSSLWGVKTGPVCCGRALPSRHFWWHRVLFTGTLSFPRFYPEFLGATEEGSKYDAFPEYSPLGGASALLNTTCRPLFSSLRAVGLSLVLQCTSGRPLVCLQAARTWFFDSLRVSDYRLFSSWLH